MGHMVRFRADHLTQQRARKRKLRITQRCRGRRESNAAKAGMSSAFGVGSLSQGTSANFAAVGGTLLDDDFGGGVFAIGGYVARKPFAIFVMLGLHMAAASSRQRGVPAR